MRGARGKLAAGLVAIAACSLPACGDDDPESLPTVGSGDAPAADRKKVTDVNVEAALTSAGIKARAEGSLALCEDRRAALIALPGKDAVRSWELAREIGPGAGLWPVLLGGDDDVGGLREALKVNCAGGGAQAVLDEAERLDAKEVLAERRDELGIKAADLKVSGPVRPPPPDHRTGFTIPTDITTGTPLPRVWMALLPTKHSWHAPALLGFGDYNDCPPPAVHAALHRDWERRFGSEIVGITADVIETKVGTPPLEQKRVVELAQEQYVYAPDIVDQGTGDVATLARALNGPDIWFFWWD